MPYHALPFNASGSVRRRTGPHGTSPQKDRVKAFTVGARHHAERRDRRARMPRISREVAILRNRCTSGRKTDAEQMGQ
jgi:hypothetical protein